MQLADIKPGMEITYHGKVYGHRNLQGKIKTKTGTVKQVTQNLIAVQGERYPDTILVNDLLSGQVKITNLKGEEEVGKKRAIPSREELLRKWIDGGYKVDPIRKAYGISWADARKWLIQAGIINEAGKPMEIDEEQKQTPPPHLGELGGENQDEGEKEPASAIISGIQYEEMTKSDTAQEEGYDLENMSAVDVASIHAEVTAKLAVSLVKRLLNDPAALALMKELIEQEVA